MSVLEATISRTTADERIGCLAGRKPCDGAVIVEITAVCEHEHVRVGLLCERHFLRLAKPRGLICRECDEHPTLPHRCYLRGAQS